MWDENVPTRGRHQCTTVAVNDRRDTVGRHNSLLYQVQYYCHSHIIQLLVARMLRIIQLKYMKSIKLFSTIRSYQT